MIKATVPILIVIAVSLCISKKGDVYGSFISGVEDGIKTVIKILPPMVAVMSAAFMLRESGVMGYLSGLIKPMLPVPLSEEAITLAFLKPVSGGGSIGLLADILRGEGPDSFSGRFASILAASSETTFYVLMVYFASTRVKYTKKVIFAALFGDFICVLCALLTTWIFF
ncbi:MAG: hypothetical protein Q4B31_01505 [Clostridia bacterium]|nr:hypothetical protein [Clostridia bacterium]